MLKNYLTIRKSLEDDLKDQIEFMLYLQRKRYPKIGPHV